MPTGKKDAFLAKLLATFAVEAEEHIRAMSSGLLELERTTELQRRSELLENIFREAHSLKGAARAVDNHEIETICHTLESTFAQLKRDELTLGPDLFDTFHRTLDELHELITNPGTRATGAGAPNAAEQLERVLHDGDVKSDGALGESKPGKGPAREPASQALPASAMPVRARREPDRSTSDTVRIPTAKLLPILREAEELVGAKLAASQRAAELYHARLMLASWDKERAKIQPDIRHLQQLVAKPDGESRPAPANGHGKGHRSLERLLAFLESSDSRHTSLKAGLAALATAGEQDRRQLAGTVEALLDDTKKMLMLPCSSLLETLPKLVRDLSRDRDKQAELLVTGADIQIDKRILEAIKDPLVHLLRNCVDHGIETPEERQRKNKPPEGRITIAVSATEGNRVQIDIADDGTGVDAAKVRTAAVKLGVLPAEQAEEISDEVALQLIFQSGVSTSPLITDLSGRGLGLAIVKEKVEQLGGTISIENRPGAGTAFHLLLPLTLATFRGVLVRVDEYLFVIPTTNVEKVLKVGVDHLRTVEGRATIGVDGQVIPSVRLADALGLLARGTSSSAAKKLHGLVLGAGETRVAFLVDEVLNEQEVLVKNFGPQLSRVWNFAGAAVLGTGKVAPILNVSDLLRSAGKTEQGTIAQSSAPSPATTRRKSILVAEDSITARILLKNILESAGYDVKTAVDGADALAVLKGAEFDLVVSDVEMPRMNGFDLTSRVRSDKKLSGLPVILVTALESRQDRERGMDVGANAYIIKSSFDHSNLLEVVARFL